jgi:hypothetical protein
LVCKQQTNQRDPSSDSKNTAQLLNLADFTSYLVLLSRYILQPKYLPIAARECTVDQRRIRLGGIRKETFTLLNEEIKILESGMKKLP